MLKMKLILSLVAFCLALNNGMGSPTGRYKYVKCNPNGDQANCVTYQGPQMELTPDLPSRLPASATDYIMGEPVVDENQEWPVEEEDEGESPVETYMYQPEEEGSGFEGSATESFIQDWPFAVVEPETGSGGSVTEDQTEQNGNEDAKEPELQEYV